MCVATKLVLSQSGSDSHTKVKDQTVTLEAISGKTQGPHPNDGLVEMVSLRSCLVLSHGQNEYKDLQYWISVPHLKEWREVLQFHQRIPSRQAAQGSSLGWI